MHIYADPWAVMSCERGVNSGTPLMDRPLLAVLTMHVLMVCSKFLEPWTFCDL